MAVLSNSTRARIGHQPSLETVLTETLSIIERLLGQARARIAAHDARTRAAAPLPSLTSAFATRREIFGAFDGEADHG